MMRFVYDKIIISEEIMSLRILLFEVAFYFSCSIILIGVIL